VGGGQEPQPRHEGFHEGSSSRFGSRAEARTPNCECKFAPVGSASTRMTRLPS
jgi:hypothetical protein